MNTPQGSSFYDGNDYRIDESVMFLMHSIHTALSAAIDQRMSEHDLTDAQWKPLLMIQQGRCSTAAELARAACVDTGAVTRLLDRIEAKGLVRRCRSLEDRRVVNLELTEDGAQAAAVVPHVLAGVLNSALAGFDADDVQQLKALLRRVLANARQLRDGVVPAIAEDGTSQKEVAP